MGRVCRDGVLEVLLEVPVISAPTSTSANMPSHAAHSTWEDRGLGMEGARAASQQRGTLVLRLINIGREPSDLDSKQAAFDSVQTSRGVCSRGDGVVACSCCRSCWRDVPYVILRSIGCMQYAATTCQAVVTQNSEQG